MSERDDAVILANKVLELPDIDPADALVILARQFLRAQATEGPRSEEREWRTIDSAPMDGSEVLLFGDWAGELYGKEDIPGRYVGYYSGGSDYPGYDWAVCGCDGYEAWVKPSHWATLLDPPR